MPDIPRRLRRLILQTAHRARCGHTGGSLSCVEILTSLYFGQMNLDPARPDWAERDRFILSKGHCTLAYYSALALRGYFPVEELATFDQAGSRLQGHPDMRKLPGVDMSTGSLGQGISAGCGMALGLKLLGSAAQVFVLTGDGELQEGQNFEALMFAGFHRLNHLTVIVDNNRLQLSGATGSLLNLEPLEAKFQAFGFAAVRVDGHDPDAISQALAQARRHPVPTAVIADTVKGKGFSRAENNVAWHAQAPGDEDMALAMEELTCSH